MSFKATQIIFDGLNSSQFGLTMISEGNKASGGIDVDYITDKHGSGYKQLLLGANYNKPLQFRISLASETPMDRGQISVIQNWLFGHNQYKKLQIVQSDMSDIFYMCVLNNPEITTYGNYPHVISFNVICDSPFAYENEVSKTITTNGIITNTSDHWDYLYPKTVIVASSSTVTITNTSDNNYKTIISNCVANETITLDGESGIVTTSRNINILDNFNKKFIRLINGNNSFTLSGVKSMNVKYNPIRKVGA